MSHHGHHNTHTADEVRDLKGVGPRLMSLGLILGGVGIGAAILVALTTGGLSGDNLRRLGLAYLGAFLFYLGLSLCALFFVNIHHLTRAGWSTVIRRISEIMAANLQVLALLAIPVLALVPTIYPWANHDGGHHFHASKAAWLSTGFFIVRIAAYFLVWIVMARWYWRKSLAQDLTGDRGITEKLQAWSGLTVVIFALTFSLAAFDLVMTLEPTWYSTMFAVYYFSGSMLGFFAVTILLTRLIQSRGVIRASVTTEHYHDLGKWLFAFTFFWGYIAYSQYMLIWYGNIPEELTFFANRGASTNPEVPAGAWGWVTTILLFGHLLIPFAALLSRHAKRNLKVLTFWAVWMFVAHFVDMFWVVMPSADADITQAKVLPSLLLMGCCWVGVGGFWLAGFARLASDRSLIPERDPRLDASLAFENY